MGEKNRDTYAVERLETLVRQIREKWPEKGKPSSNAMLIALAILDGFEAVEVEASLIRMSIP